VNLWIANGGLPNTLGRLPCFDWVRCCSGLLFGSGLLLGSGFVRLLFGGVQFWFGGIIPVTEALPFAREPVPNVVFFFF
jgi:hypothetical protein